MLLFLLGFHLLLVFIRGSLFLQLHVLPVLEDLLVLELDLIEGLGRLDLRQVGHDHCQEELEHVVVAQDDYQAKVDLSEQAAVTVTLITNARLTCKKCLNR